MKQEKFWGGTFASWIKQVLFHLKFVVLGIKLGIKTFDVLLFLLKCFFS